MMTAILTVLGIGFLLLILAGVALFALLKKGGKSLFGMKRRPFTSSGMFGKGHGHHGHHTYGHRHYKHKHSSRSFFSS